MPTVLVYDIGTTTVKAALLDTDVLKVTKQNSEPLPIKYPSLKEAEIDPIELWNTVSKVSKNLLKEESSQPEAVTIISQMAGVLPVNKEGEPLANILTWLDERAAGYPHKLFRGLIKVSGYNLFELIKFLRITGGAPSKTGKDAISKIIWLKEERPQIWDKTDKILDVKGYLLYKMTNEFVTTVDEANLSWLMDTRPGKMDWSDSILESYGIPVEKLPRILEPATIVGPLTKEASLSLGVKESTPVIAGSGDVVGVATGSGLTRPGETHVYIGTSNWLAAHTEKRLLDIFHYMGSLLSAIPGRYLFIAEQEVAGGALEWFLDRLKCHGNERYSCLNEMIKRSQPGSRGLMFAPWMYGERSPIDDEFVRGVLINISLSHGDEDILRAVIEGVAYNIRFAYDYYVKHVGRPKYVNIAGGGSLLDEWCQIIADLLDVEVRRTVQPRMVGVRGGGIIAGVSLGYYRSFDDASKLVGIEKTFTPREGLRELYQEMYDRYKNLYTSTKKLFRRFNKSH